jgi:hypothetical protein
MTGARHFQTEDRLAMPYRHAADTANRHPQGMTFPRKRHFAAWLVLGWAMFWLFSVLQPCDLKLAAGGPGQSAAVRIFDNASGPGNPYCSAHRGDGMCQSLSVAQTGASDTASAATYRVVSSFDTAPAAFMAAPRDARTAIAHAGSDSPRSGTPVYLRHRRLLL